MGVGEWAAFLVFRYTYVRLHEALALIITGFNAFTLPM